jgi:protein SCO1/2
MSGLDGARMFLPTELDDGRPVVMNFIYTTCTTIFPLSSQVFELFQRRLGAKRNRVHLVSISIDPKEGTAGQLRQYAERYYAGSE